MIYNHNERNQALITGSLIFVVGLLMMVSTAQAKNYQRQTNNVSNKAFNNTVTVYQDCGFRGKSAHVPVGEVQRLKSIRIGNDSISSIRVPVGLDVTVYQNDRFKGFSTTISQDVNCLDSGWNDQISSLKVSYSDDRNSGYSGSGYSGLSNSGQPQYLQDGVNGNNVVKVEFAGTFLKKVNKSDWQITSRNGGKNYFRQLDKNINGVYLQGRDSHERVNIDFFTNEVVVIDGNGQLSRYKIDRALRMNDNHHPAVHQTYGSLFNTAPKSISSPAPKVTQTPPVIRGQCFNIKAYTNGGMGGVKFYDHEGFHQFNKKTAYRGQLCHKGKLTMEINKTSLATDVTVEINGVKHRFAVNEQPDIFLNTWYRKRVKLYVAP